MVMQAQRLLKFCILGVSLSLYRTSTYSFNNILKYLCEPNTALDARHPEEQQSDKSFCPQSWVAIRGIWLLLTNPKIWQYEAILL